MGWWVVVSTTPPSVAIAVLVGLMLLITVFVRVFRQKGSETHKRGAVLRDATAAQRRTSRWRWSSGSVLTVAGIPVPSHDETKHFKIVGTTGTGKSTAIRELLGAALARGDRAVIADPDGGYAARFLDRRRGDIVLNPFERCSVKWDLFSEIRDLYDIEQLAISLIPATNDATSGEWRGYARTFLSAVVRRCRAEEDRDCVELWRLLAIASSDELQKIVAGTPAQPFLDPENGRMFGSIRSVAVSAIAALEYVQAQRGVRFSVRHWVRSRASPGTLFIPYRASQIAALKSMIATWMRLAIFEAMEGPEDRDQRLWFVVDELDALGAIDGLKDALARLRKFGGRCVLGFQSAAQVSNTYGAGEAQTLVENCGNTLILRCSGSENGGTSQFASRLIGEREIVRRQISRGSDHEATFSIRGVRRSKNSSDHHITEAAVMPSEIEQLPDLCGYFKSASSPAWLKVALSADRGVPAHRRFRVS
jgi:type IV secretory pathway TraG/TraD family ATPase VirD4